METLIVSAGDDRRSKETLRTTIENVQRPDTIISILFKHDEEAREEYYWGQ